MRESMMLERITAGDPSGLKALMELYVPYVSAIVWNILRGAMPPQDAEEVVSDVFIAAWEQAADLKSGHVKAWLGAVARNKAKNRLRQMGRTISLEENTVDLPVPSDLSEAMERDEERRLVRQAVDALPGADREIFLRHYYYAQSVKEISTHMALNESTIKTRLRRGRMKLKEVLTKGGAGA